MKRLLKKLSFYIHRIFARIGIFIIPVHYYTPFANVNYLAKTKEHWAFKSELPGVHSDLDEQSENLLGICLPYQKEYLKNEAFLEATGNHFGPGYGFIEAQALHGFLRYFKPKHVVEVGSGVSTFCINHALQFNNNNFSLSCIEPYPSRKLKNMSEIRLIEKRVQEISFELHKVLNEGDLLFIDSSHAIRPGGDVNFLILEVLPRLKPGVFIHLHDIFLPYDYPPNVLTSYFQWMETSLLRAFLVNNQKIETLFCLSQLHYGRKKVLKKVFPDYNPAQDLNGLEINSMQANSENHYPASIYLKTV